MARVTAIFEDSGPDDVTITLLSDPDIPLENGAPAVDDPGFTGAMAFAIAATEHVADMAKSRTTVARERQPEDPRP